MTLDKLLRPGKRVKVFYNKGNVNNQIRHIRAIVDDEYIVYRIWSKRKGWLYRIEHRYDFEYKYEIGRLTNA